MLAGGAGSRLGGSKATVELDGRPLIAYPLAAFAAAGIETIVVAKPSSELPALDVPVVTEPAEPRHPLLGIVSALEHAQARPVVVCACDTPFVTPELLGRLARAARTAAVTADGRTHPLLARYEPGDLDPLRGALEEPASATAALERLDPATIPASSADVFNVNTPEDLKLASERAGAQRRRFA